MTQLHLIINGEEILAELDDSPAARDFASLLPMTLSLSDYARKEKVSDLPRRLDTTGAPSGHTPEAGDITYYAPWGNLAIFYQGFSHATGLVRLGRITGSLNALSRSGNVTTHIETLA